MAHAIGCHHLAIEGRGEKLRFRHVIVEESDLEAGALGDDTTEGRLG